MSNESKSQASGSPLNASASEAVEAVTELGRDIFKGALMTGAEVAAQGYRNIANIASAQMKIARTSRARAAEDNSLSALAASSEAFANGVQTYMEQMITYVRSATEENIAGVDHAGSAKNPQEWLEAQTEASGRMMSRWVAQASELNRIVADTARRSFAPLEDRAAAAARDVT